MLFSAVFAVLLNRLTSQLTYGDSDDDDVAPAKPPAASPEELLHTRLKAARAAQRERSAGAPRHRGMAFYPTAPVLAFDEALSRWYAARLVHVDAAARTCRVHFVGWHARFDFTADWDSPRLKPGSTDTAVRHRSGKPVEDSP